MLSTTDEQSMNAGPDLQLTPTQTLICMTSPDRQQAAATLQLANTSSEHALAFNVRKLSSSGESDSSHMLPTMSVSMPAGHLQPGAATTVELFVKPAKDQAVLQAGQTYSVRVRYSRVAPDSTAVCASEHLQTAAAQRVHVKTLRLQMVRLRHADPNATSRIGGVCCFLAQL